MASETQIGQLVIDLKIKTEALEKGLETAKKKLQSIEQGNKEIENSNKNLDASYLAMSATAVLSLGKIVSAIKDCVDEYNSYTQAMSSLQNVSEYTGESMEDLSGIMNKFGAYMTKADLATTIKNFSLMGFTAQQTEQMIEALTNSAIRNRNANYTVSEAVRVASEGYRQGLSTLSDSAGVTENLSVMLDNYAKSIGKTASQLTEAEQNQAYLNRTMYAAEPFAGAMADYMDTLAGKQGQYSQAMRETQVAFTESLEPTLAKLEELKTGLISTLGEYIEKNKAGTAGIVSFGIALTSFIAIVKLAKTAMSLLNATMIANPATALIAVLATLTGVSVSVATALEEQKSKQAELKAEQEEYNSVLNNTIELEDKRINSVNKTAEDLDNYVKKLKESTELRQVLNTVLAAEDEFKGSKLTEEESKQYDKLKKMAKELSTQLAKVNDELGEQSNEFKEKFQIEKKGLLVEDDLKDIQKVYNKEVEKGKVVQNIKNSMDLTSVKNQQKQAAQLKVNVEENQRLLNLYKNSKKGTDDYNTALQALIKAYPECVTAQGLVVDSVQNFINAENDKANASWNSSQSMIQNYANQIQMALQDEAIQKQICANLGEDWGTLEGKLRNVLAVLQALAGVTPENVQGITIPTTSPVVKKSSSGSKTYQNKALDNYKKQIEHKKALDQISLQDEINMYQIALKKYAKTQDEKWELTEKIYELQKELQEKSLDDYTAMIEHRKSLDQISLQDEINMYQYAYNSLAKTTEQKQELEEKLYELRKELAQKNKDLLEQQTTDYERYIEDQKNLRGAEYDAKEQEADLNKIIALHKSYLNQIMRDERLSLDERKELYQEELDTIRDYEKQKRDLRVQAVDDTVSKLTSAITKQLEELEEADKKAIESNIEAVEKWKETRVNAINEEYNARIEAIQKELDLLDKSEEDKTRAEEDAEYERKKNRLQQLIEYEHDATTKANYQKELDKLVTEYQKTLDKRALADRKEALNAQKDLLKDEQDDKIQNIEDEAEKRKEQYEKQLDELEEYYDKQKELAQETAEKMLLNVDQNQNKILELLKSYGDAYEITGQSLGEKLAQGINNGIADKIQNLIQKIQDKIDAGIENKIKEWTSGMYKYEAGSNKPKTQTINVYQTNNIEQNPEMPSETYRKLHNVSENLAAQLRAEGI